MLNCPRAACRLRKHAPAVTRPCSRQGAARVYSQACPIYILRLALTIIQKRVSRLQRQQIDLLAVQSTREARNGQIVVARLGEEVTVKRYRRTPHAIELHAENPDYPTIIVEPGEPFAIEGLAVGLIRNTMLM